MRRTSSISVLLVVLLISSGCASLSGVFGGKAEAPRIATGTLLADVGDQFLKTAELYDRLLAAKSITPDEYRPWVEFVPKFQLAYDKAYLVWKAVGSEDEARKLIEQLRTDLLIYVIRATRRVTP